MNELKGMRYVYFGNTNGCQFHDGVVAVGYVFNPETKRMQYAVAFCSPNDRFSKPKAHTIINSRMTAGLYNESDNTFEIPPKYADTIADIIACFTAAVEKFQFDDPTTSYVSISRVIKEWVLAGKDFTDEDIYDAMANRYLNECAYVTLDVFPEFCGVNVPFWALSGIVQPR